MELGEALYREITNGRSPYTEVATFGGAVEYFLTSAGGIAAAAARAAGVPASTFRGWMRGRQPKTGNAAGMVGAAIRAQRRERLPRGREKRLRRPGALDDAKIVGGLTYGSTPEPDRDIDLGAYLDEVQDALIDAYLDGEPIEVLAEIFHDGITGAPFYEQTFEPGAEMGWDISDLDGWA